VLFEHLGNDLRHAHVLEHALVDAVGQVRQLRAQGHLVAGQALACLALRGAVDQAVQAPAVVAELKERGLVQQVFQVQRGALADQLQVDGVGLADGFRAVEGKHLEVMLQAIDVQAEVGLVRGGKHPCPSVREFGW
jgi:hypothetical protein